MGFLKFDRLVTLLVYLALGVGALFYSIAEGARDGDWLGGIGGGLVVLVLMAGTGWVLFKLISRRIRD